MFRKFRFFSFLHVVGKTVCLSLLCPGAREACTGVSTNSISLPLGLHGFQAVLDWYQALFGILGGWPPTPTPSVAVRIAQGGNILQKKRISQGSSLCCWCTVAHWALSGTPLEAAHHWFHPYACPFPPQATCHACTFRLQVYIWSTLSI
jgi:hypothetical protein